MTYLDGKTSLCLENEIEDGGHEYPWMTKDILCLDDLMEFVDLFCRKIADIGIFDLSSRLTLPLQKSVSVGIWPFQYSLTWRLGWYVGQ